MLHFMPVHGEPDHRHSQDFLWEGALYSSKKLTTFFLFLVVALKAQAKTTK